MKYVFDELDKIKKTLTGKNIFLFLDYDGTLTSIVDHPDKAFLSDELKKILLRLIRKPRFSVAIISGRSLKDIKKRVAIKQITYSGNHGLEIESPSFKFRNHVTASYKRKLGKIKKELQLALSGFKGVFIEDKNLTLSVHYRLAGKKNIFGIRIAFHKIVKNYHEAKEIKVRTGKMVFEIVPAGKWNKGFAVLWIMGRPEFSKDNFFPLYIGDDITDEDAFRVLKKSGITVLVGYRKKSQAQFYLDNVSEVEKFAEQL